VKLSVKRISSIDIGALREMSVDFVDETPMPYPAVDKAEIDKHMFEVLANKDNPDYVGLIAYDGKKPAGFLIGWVVDKPYTQPSRVAVAQELYVVPEKRAGIVGLRLMEEAGRIAVERGAKGFECAGTYQGTDKRWEKFGFKPFLTYGYMDPKDFMDLVTRFTRGRPKAA